MAVMRAASVTVLDVIYLELLGMPEVLKDLFVFVSNSNFHNNLQIVDEFSVSRCARRWVMKLRISQIRA